MEYNINTEQSILGTKIEITSESDTEYVIDIDVDTIIVAFSKFKNADLEGSDSPCL